MYFSSSWSLRPCFRAWLRTNARSSNATGQFLAARLQIVLSTCGCDDIVWCVDNDGIWHTVRNWCNNLPNYCSEKFVVMAMNPGADLDSLPILDNPDDFCCACLRRIYLGAFLRCHQQLPQLNSSGSYFTRSIQGNACSSLVCQIWLHYPLGITDRKSSWCWHNVCSRLLISTQSASPHCHLLSISVGLLTRIIVAFRLPTISSSTVLRFC